MTSPSLLAADPVYKAARDLVISTHAVQNPLLKRFSYLIRRGEGILGASSSDDYWSPVLRRLRVLRFDLSAAPLSVEDSTTLCRETREWATGRLAHVEISYPQMATIVDELLQSLEALSCMTSNPLLDTCIELAEGTGGQRCAVLLREPRHVSKVLDAFSRVHVLRSWELVTVSNLTGTATFDNLIVVGPPRWYPDFVFIAPRSPRISLAVYGWIGTSWKPRTALIKPIAASSNNTITHEMPVAQLESKEPLLPESLLPTIDFDRIASRLSHDGLQEYDDIVEGKLVALEPEHAVFLEDSETASVLVVDLESHESGKVDRVRTREIAPGTFLLLRVEGGGDFIVPVANRIMGTHAQHARDLQSEWKSLLRGMVRKHGIDEVTSRLKALGTNRANYTNVRNWMSSRSIRTGDFADFLGIMRLIGLTNSAREYWDIMGVIDRAHRMAGMRIRNLLLARVKEIDIDKMKRDGFAEVSLPDQDAGSLGAFRVVEVSKQLVDVPAGMIGEPFKVDDNGENAPR